MSQISFKSFTMRVESLQRLGRPGLLPIPPKLTSPCNKFVSKSGKKQYILAGMYVPNDSFGGISPEKKAGQALRNMFTFLAARIVLAQWEGSGRGDLGSYGGGDYAQLRNFLLENPMKDGDEWCAKLLIANKAVAMRVMEARL